MLINKILSALTLSVVLSGCAIQSQESFDAAPFITEVAVARNYQAVYADIIRGARLCWGSGPIVSAAPAAMDIDAQLYPDLGYGEIYHYASGTVFLPYVLVRVERSGSQTVVRTKTGPAANARAVFSDRAIRWANGDVTCR